MNNFCQHCNKICDDSWMILKNDDIILDTEEKKAPKYLHYCSYICHNRERINLPKSIWNILENKEDFNLKLVPIINYKKDKFQYLTYEELKKMSDDEKYNYYLEKDNQMDSYRNSIHDEIEKEDEYTSYLENINDSFSDDY